MPELHVFHPTFGHLTMVDGSLRNLGGLTAWALDDPRAIEKVKEEVRAANAAVGVALRAAFPDSDHSLTDLPIPPTLPGIEANAKTWIARSIPLADGVSDAYPRKKPWKWIEEGASAIVIGIDGRVAKAKLSRHAGGDVSLVFERWEDTWAAPILSRIVAHDVGIRALVSPPFHDPIGEGWLECAPIIKRKGLPAPVTTCRRWSFQGPFIGSWTPIASNWRPVNQ